jgi:hypothetical protein
MYIRFLHLIYSFVAVDDVKFCYGIGMDSEIKIHIMHLAFLFKRSCVLLGNIIMFAYFLFSLSFVIGNDVAII